MSTVETNIELVGWDGIEQALLGLSARMAKKAVDGAITYAKTPMLKEAQEKAAKAEADHLMKYGDKYELVHPGLLKESIKWRKLKPKELQELGVSAGGAIYIGKGKTQKLYPRYWHFVEFGTSRLPPAPYFRPAFEQNKQQFLDRFCQRFRQNITRFGGAWTQDNDFAQF